MINGGKVTTENGTDLWFKKTAEAGAICVQRFTVIETELSIEEMQMLAAQIENILTHHNPKVAA